MSSDTKTLENSKGNSATDAETKNPSSSDSRAIEQLVTQGNMAYAQKNYEEAVDKYGQALMQSESIHGSESLENRNVLWLYGKSLFQIAIENSQVLGNALGAKESVSQATESFEEPEAIGSFTFSGQKIENKYTVNEENSPIAHPEKESEEKETNEASPASEDDEDDFNVAWEVLDLTRVMQSKAVDAYPDSKDEKIRLADIYDLLGELSLEIENFSQASQDLKTALEWKEKVYNVSNNTLLSEAHYKLALALEFTNPEDPSNKSRACEHVEKAAEILKNVLNERESEVTDKKGKGKQKAEESTLTSDLENLREMLSELEQKALDLKHGAPSLEEAVMSKMHESSLLSKDSSSLAQAVAEAVKNANDLGGLVKRKRTKQEVTGSSQKEGPKDKKKKD